MKIKENAKLNELSNDDKNLLNDVIDNLYTKNELKFGAIKVNHYKILERLQVLDKSTLVHTLSIF